MCVTKDILTKTRNLVYHYWISIIFLWGKLEQLHASLLKGKQYTKNLSPTMPRATYIKQIYHIKCSIFNLNLYEDKCESQNKMSLYSCNILFCLQGVRFHWHRLPHKMLWFSVTYLLHVLNPVTDISSRQNITKDMSWGYVLLNETSLINTNR